MCQLARYRADMAQSVERHLGKVEVTGSIPVISFWDALMCVPFLLPKFFIANA